MSKLNELVGYDNPTKRTNQELAQLYAGIDGYIAFLVKDQTTGKMRMHSGIPTEFLHHPDRYLFNLWDLIDRDLDVDGYHSINASYRRGHGYSKQLRSDIVDPITQKPFHIPARKTKDLSNLGALYVDCDCYAKNLSAAYVQYQITEMVDAGELPQPSYFKDSGQGLWAFWLLTPTKAFNKSPFDQIPSYRRIQRTIVRKLKHLGADANCTDATRITRNHGSLNSKSKTRVRMHLVYIDGKVPRYDLAYLEDFFGCYPEYKLNPLDVESVQPYRLAAEDPPAITGSQSQPPRASKRTGRVNARWPLELKRFWVLTEDIRGIVPEGRRNAHAFVLGHILKHLLGSDPNRAAAITTAAKRLHDCCANPETKPLDELTKELTAAAEPSLDADDNPILSHQDIANRLAITTNESKLINEQIHRRRSKGWPPAEGEEPATRALTRKEQKARRLEILKGWYPSIMGQHKKPSFASLAERLTDMGLPCDASTVCREWRLILPPPDHIQKLLDLDAAPPIEFSFKKPEPTKTLTPSEVVDELRRLEGF